MNRFRTFRSALLLLTIASTPVFAGDWTYALGIHDMIVPDADSDTFGINATAYYDHTTASGTRFVGNFDLFLDNDKDDLDPDHIPVWWRLNFEARNALTTVSNNLKLDWLIDWNSKANTVSCIERQIKVMPGMILEYDTGSFHASVKGLVGFYFLEIDDDVPDLRGYSREDYRKPTGAFSVMADAGFALGKSSHLYASAQQWHDGDTWLDNLYTVSLRYKTDLWHADSEFIFGVDFSEYNLDVYYPSSLGNPPTVPYLPILPWDNDVLVKLSFRSSW